MDYYTIVERYYNYIKYDGTRMYSRENVAKFVAYGKLTKEQYKAIVGEDYDKPVTSPVETTTQV